MTTATRNKLLDKVAFDADFCDEPKFVLWDGKIGLDDGFTGDPVFVCPRLICPHCGVHGLMSADRLSSDPPLGGRKNRRTRYLCHSCRRTSSQKIWADTPADYGDNLEVYEVDYTVSAHDFED